MSEQATSPAPAAEHHPCGPSSLERRFLCPGSLAMESELPDVPSDEAAERGTRIHAYVEAMLRERFHKQPMEPLDESDEEVRLARGIVEFVESEAQANGWTGDQMIVEAHLSYSSFNGELYFGRSDLVVVGSDMVYVYDWKTGRKAVTDASNNLQGAGYGLAAMQTFGFDRCMVTFYNPVIRQRTSFLFDEPATVAEKITDIIAACHAPHAKRRAGDIQCRYCKGALLCACAEYLETYRPALAVAERTDILPLSEWRDEQVAGLYGRCRQIDKVKALVEKELKERIQRNGACAGYVARESSGGREASDVNGIFAAVADLFTPDAFVSFCKLSLPALEKEYAARALKAGKVSTLKDGAATFRNLVAPYCSERPPRVNLVDAGEKALP